MPSLPARSGWPTWCRAVILILPWQGPLGRTVPTPMPGMAVTTHGRGQRVSLERGVATRSKKNPGKRSKKGG